ncbi:MAG: hypothetical protein JJU11_11700 [Candidatus Sumerlaeia bacterium]|nr:hypothetical protein [Candidatus Sumerlaeia bacterium]
MIPIISHLLPALLFLLAGRVIFQLFFKSSSLIPQARSRMEYFMFRAALYFTIGGGALSFLLAVVGHLSTSWFLWLPILLAIPGVFIGSPWRNPAMNLPWLCRETTRGDFLLVGTIVVSAVLGLLGALTPEVRHDSLFYHLQIPLLWLNEGRMIEVPENGHSYFPYGLEMIYTSAMLMVDDSAAKVVHWVTGLVAMVWCIILARSSGNGILAGALFYFLPTMVYLSTTTYIDLGTAMYGLGAIAIFLQVNRGGWRWHEGLLFGFIAGSAMATKYTAWALLSVPLGVLSLVMFLRHPKILFITGAGVFIALAPWIIRNLVYVGNPVAPLMIRLFGPESAHETGLAGAFDAFAGRSSGAMDYLLAPINYALHLIHQKYTISLLGLLAIPLLVYTFGRREDDAPPIREHTVLMGLLVGMFLCEALFTRGHPDGRYGLTSMGIGAVLIAITASSVTRHLGNNGLERGAYLLAVALFASSLFDYTRHQNQLGERWIPVFSADARLQYRIDQGAAPAGFGEREAYLLANNPGRVTGHNYPSATLYWVWIQGIRNEPVMVAGGADAPPEGIANAMRELNFTHFVDGVNPGFNEINWREFLDGWTDWVEVGGATIHSMHRNP